MRCAARSEFGRRAGRSGAETGERGVAKPRGRGLGQRNTNLSLFLDNYILDFTTTKHGQRQRYTENIIHKKAHDATEMVSSWLHWCVDMQTFQAANP